ncbi:MAG: hypothetical protein HY673_24215 [Chloroflexi bacterium]|nr:hypothetical protein [Chloroflexota bacterium]
MVVLLLSTGLLACSPGTTPQATPAPTGVIEGTVTIGPISPVERPGVTPIVPPQVFEARKVVITSERGDKVATVDIAQVDQSSTGRYSVRLAPGDYTIDINRAGIDRAREVPRKVAVRSGETVRVDINIDTGIR